MFTVGGKLTYVFKVFAYIMLSLGPHCRLHVCDIIQEDIIIDIIYYSTLDGNTTINARACGV